MGNYNLKYKAQLYEFATSTILVAGAAAIILEEPVDYERLGVDYFDRSETIHAVLDADGDKEISATEIAEAIFLAEYLEYFTFGEAAYLSWCMTHLFITFGETISLDEIDLAMAEIILDGEQEYPYEHILFLIEYMEDMVLMHGAVMDYLDWDTDGDWVLSPRELAKAGILRHGKEFDEDSSGDWDIDEYENYFFEQMLTDDDFADEQYEEYAANIQHNGWGMGVI